MLCNLEPALLTLLASVLRLYDPNCCTLASMARADGDDGINESACVALDVVTRQQQYTIGNLIPLQFA